MHPGATVVVPSAFLLSNHSKPMLKGTVSSYNPRRGTGYVRHDRGSTSFPFSLRSAHDDQFTDGDTVEFTVVGGLTGVAARGVRRVERAA